VSDGAPSDVTSIGTGHGPPKVPTLCRNALEISHLQTRQYLLQMKSPGYTNTRVFQSSATVKLVTKHAGWSKDCLVSGTNALDCKKLCRMLIKLDTAFRYFYMKETEIKKRFCNFLSVKSFRCWVGGTVFKRQKNEGCPIGRSQLQL